MFFILGDFPKTGVRKPTFFQPYEDAFASIILTAVFHTFLFLNHTH